MIRYKIVSLLIFVLLLTALACSRESHEAGDREVQHLVAFAKVYGHVKYFHPSDEARQIDWDKLAVLGVRKIREAGNQGELKPVLENLFLPIAPTVKIVETEPSENSFFQQYIEQIGSDTSGLNTVAWQHIGVDMDQDNPAYASKRINRKDKVYGRNFYLYQNLEVSEFKGDSIRFQASVKTDIQTTNTENNGEIRLEIDDLNRSPFFNRKEKKKVITPNTWENVSLVTTIDRTARQATIGIKLNGDGKLWVDNLRLDVKTGENQWEPVSVNNPVFENHTNGRPAGWRSTAKGPYDFTVVSGDSFEGDNSFYMASREPDLPDSLFEQVPVVGETAVQKIDDGLWNEAPLALFSDESKTLPEGSQEDLARLLSELNSFNLSAATADDENIRLANIIIAWNEFQHFYPYFDVVDTDWEMQLEKSLSEAMSDSSATDFYKTLSNMLASLKDGHIFLRHSSERNNAGLPFLVDFVEDQVVVTHSLHKEIQPGDIVVSLDGESAMDVVKNKQKFISGSPQLSLFRALRQFGTGNFYTDATVEVKGRDEIKTYSIERSSLPTIYRVEKAHLPVLGKLEDDIYYVDLDRAAMDQINSEIENIASAKGVIFDLRGYPNGNHQVISHLLTESDTSGQWMQKPQIIYPDRKNIEGYQKNGWFMRPAEPHIQGKVAFITDSRAISYAESFMSFIEHYGLGEIVGQPTAGTNGNVNTVQLPGGYLFGWTGMKVVKHDGAQQHLIGIQPTLHVHKTIEGLRRGEDEFLEKAIEVVQ